LWGFCSTKRRFERSGKEKAKSGILVFNVVVGGILVLFFIGLPIGIIGLFVESILDRRPASSNRTIKRLPEAPTAEMNHNRRDRRAVIYETYGRRSTSATTAAERSKSTETAETEGR
jgi:hypothetical protein